MRFARPVFFLSFVLSLNVIFLSVQANAANFTVKSGGGGNYATIQACANAASAGDTCTVFSGNYGETVTLPKSGAQGSPITFQANPGDNVTLQGWNIGNHSWIVIGGSDPDSGFEVTQGAGFTWTTMSHVVIQNNNVHHTSGRCFQGPSGDGSGPAAYNSVLNNIITYCGNADSQGFLIEGNHWLISGNTISHVEDGIALYGDHHVVRDNKFGPVVQSEYGSQHPDALESSCAGDFPLTRMVFEGNTITNWGQSDAHVFLLRDTNNCGMTDQIIRLNSASNIGSYFAANDTNSRNVRIYSNSISNTQSASSTKDMTDLSFTDNDTGAKVINNILADMTKPNNTNWCIYYDPSSASGFVEHNNLCYNPGYTGSWKGPASTLSTLAASSASTDLFNKDPKFVNPDSDLRTQAGSAAIGAGGALTNASGSGSGQSLTVADAGFFQDGYGISDVQPDWIRIGSSTAVQIKSINYSTNVITLANAVSWVANDPVYLYKDSQGNVVLKGAKPDIGAVQSGSSAPSTPSPTAPPPPVNLRAIIN